LRKIIKFETLEKRWEIASPEGISLVSFEINNGQTKTLGCKNPNLEEFLRKKVSYICFGIFPGRFSVK